MEDSEKKGVISKEKEKEEMSRQSPEDFQGSETILLNTIMLDTCHYTFVHTHTMYNIKSEPQGKPCTLGVYC